MFTQLATGVAPASNLKSVAKGLHALDESGAKVVDVRRDGSVFYLDVAGDDRYGVPRAFTLPMRQASRFEAAVEAARLSATFIDGEGLLRSRLISDTLFRSAGLTSYEMKMDPNLSIAGLPSLADAAAVAYRSIAQELELPAAGPESAAQLRDQAGDVHDPMAREALDIVLEYFNRRGDVSNLARAIAAEDVREKSLQRLRGAEVPLRELDGAIGEMQHAGLKIDGMGFDGDRRFHIDYTDRGIKRRIGFEASERLSQELLDPRGKDGNAGSAGFLVGAVELPVKHRGNLWASIFGDQDPELRGNFLWSGLCGNQDRGPELRRSLWSGLFDVQDPGPEFCSGKRDE